MAASSSSPSSSAATAAAIGKMVHRPIHLDTSPYGRPPTLHQALPGHRIASPQETLLQVYAKSLGFAGHHPAFSPLGLNGLGTPLGPCPPLGEPLPTSLQGPLPPSLQPIINRPVATRPIPPSSSPSTHSLHHILPGGAKITPAPPPPPPNNRPEG